MADISRRFGWRHLRGSSVAHVRHLRRGGTAHEGTGLSFWFRPRAAVLSEVPVDDRELPMLFHAITADFQDVTVQASATFRITDPELAASRVDFGISPDTGDWRGTPLDQLAGLITETAQQHAKDLIARTELTSALVEGVAAVRDRVAHALATDPRLAETGVSVVAVRVIMIRPERDVEQALRAPRREKIQQDADRAGYERRALAVERERAISENELQNKIELARREEQLVAQQGANFRRQAEDKAATNRIATEAEASRQRALGAAKADATRALGEAEAAAESARLAAYAELSEATLRALAAKELAGNLPAIQHLTVTPDLLAPLLTKLAGESS